MAGSGGQLIAQSLRNSGELERAHETRKKTKRGETRIPHIVPVRPSPSRYPGGKGRSEGRSVDDLRSGRELKSHHIGGRHGKLRASQADREMEREVA